MSRLQKKKTVNEKAKKKIETGNKAESSDSTSKISGIKSAALSTPSKAKSEKNLAEVKSAAPNFLQKAIEFLREVKVELKKVTWPTRKQTTGTTIVVIIFVFVLAAFLGLFDFGLSKLVQVVLT